MLSFALGEVVNLDIYIYDREGGSLVDPDGYAGSTEPSLKIYNQSGSLVKEETDNTNVTRLSVGHYRYTSYTIPAGETIGSNWRIVWYFNINGNLLTASLRTEYFEVVAAGAVSYSAPYDAKDEVVELVEGLTESDIQGTWRDWAKVCIDLECGHDFYSHDSDTEYYDIVDSQSVLLLRNYPVLALTQLRDNVNGIYTQTPTTIDDDYHLESEAGIITLLGGTQSYFTTGKANADVEYTYGYSSTPVEVRMLANMLVAFRAQIYLLEKNGESIFGLQSLQIADYRETFGQDLGPIKAKLVDDIKRMMLLVKRKYGKKFV